MDTGERTTQFFSGTLRNILDDISDGLNDKLKEMFFDAVNNSSKYDPTDLEQTIKIIDFLTSSKGQSFYWRPNLN